jgi:hypothetical protein
MGVLRKKIDRANLATPLDIDKVKFAWSNPHEKILDVFLNEIEPLHWKKTSIELSQMIPSDMPNVCPKSAIYISLGETERVVNCVLLFDVKIAAIFSKFGFSGKVTDLDGLDEYEFSRFDIMVLDNIIKKVQIALGMSAFTAKSEYIEFSDIPIDQDPLEWVKIDLNFDVSLRPKSKKEPFGISVLMLKAHMNETLTEFIEQAPEEETVEFDEDTETLTRHIDSSVTSLRAVLESREMTVADCTRLEIGQVIPLPGVSLQELRLEAELKENRVCITKGALGIHKTRRAVKLVEDISPDFLDKETLRTIVQ